MLRRLVRWEEELASPALGQGVFRPELLRPPLEANGKPQSISKETVERAMETIRKRIDRFGVAEPSITPQGTDRKIGRAHV